MRARKYDEEAKHTRAVLLYQQMQKNEEKDAQQLTKNFCYRSIKGLRESWDYKASDTDELGFNLLHWAVLCNQEKEIPDLLKEMKDINCVTQQAKKLTTRHMTALWIAVKRNYVVVTKLLVEAKADPSLTPEKYIQAQGLIVDCSGWFKENSALALAKDHNSSDIIKLIEKSFSRAYITKRSTDPNEYKTTISFGLFDKKCGYSKTDKVSAASALEVALNSEQCTEESLNQLLLKHPALGTGELNTIFEASRVARKL